MSFARGRVCRTDEELNLDRAVVIAEVFSRAVRPSDEGFVACYFLAHDLDEEEARRAMNFFAAQPSLLVDKHRLVEDAAAELPALVTIRYHEDPKNLLATALEYGILRELPDEQTVSQSGWDLFWAYDALKRGEEVPEAEGLPAFDYRALRRKTLALRAAVLDDRDPWLKEEYDRLRKLTEGSPEGCEKFVAMADDIQAALNGEIEIGETYSIVIPTKVERPKEVGAIMDWVPQTGREIVVAHGLNALQAARSLAIVQGNPKEFVSEAQLLSGAKGREELLAPLVIPDMGLNWIATDFSGRRSVKGYERLASLLNGSRAADQMPAIQPSHSR